MQRPNIQMLLLKVKVTLIFPIDHVISSVSGVKELDILLLNSKIMMGNGEIESESSSDDEMSPLEDCSNVKIVEPIDGVVLVTRRALSIQPKEDGDVEQHEHIFHIRYHINDKICSMIIDNGSCTNVASTLLVEKLNLPTKKHLNSYRLQRLNDCGDIRYKDEVLCDVAPMPAGNLLFGRPWQFNRKVTHDGYKNRHHRITPLKPIEAYFDQIRIVRELREEHVSIQEKERKENMSGNKQKK
ncbi:hypothetical protein CR513_12307, partial [Mucuna pruriens]